MLLRAFRPLATGLLLTLGLASLAQNGATTTAPSQKNTASLSRYCINRAGTAVYSQPSFQAAVRQQLPVGQAIRVAEVRPSSATCTIGPGLALPGDWLRIDLNGTPGYVFSSDVTARRPQVLRDSDGRAYVSLLGVEGRHRTLQQPGVSNHPGDKAEVTITQFANGTYTYTAYDGCFDHVYVFTTLTLAEAYHQMINSHSAYENGKLRQPQLSARKGKEILFENKEVAGDASQDLKLVIRPDKRIELRSYDCT
ncbi:SH3 domain-containing protein [Hymenobacter rigui]|uniref:SH3 domain-containing protein n=1 Tax=Hymenobacter rigui TaxID=334424 RepID=A0A3R9PXM6_9BACT|nr:SH3 domain-containing protein [Hymenobacter rigui]RSK48429.1 hypothetical protein EI291_11975 [Hymenobacter rigui]